MLTKLASVSVAGRPVAQAIAGLVKLTVGGLLLLSAFYNCEQYWLGTSIQGWGKWRVVLAGTAIPALMFAFSQIAARLWLCSSKRD